jgi:hypothetical protein
LEKIDLALTWESGLERSILGRIEKPRGREQFDQPARVRYFESEAERICEQQLNTSLEQSERTVNSLKQLQEQIKKERRDITDPV